MQIYSQTKKAETNEDKQSIQMMQEVPYSKVLKQELFLLRMMALDGTRLDGPYDLAKVGETYSN